MNRKPPLLAFLVYILTTVFALVTADAMIKAFIVLHMTLVEEHKWCMWCSEMDTMNVTFMVDIDGDGVKEEVPVVPCCSTASCAHCCIVYHAVVLNKTVDWNTCYELCTPKNILPGHAQ